MYFLSSRFPSLILHLLLPSLASHRRLLVSRKWMLIRVNRLQLSVKENQVLSYFSDYILMQFALWRKNMTWKTCQHLWRRIIDSKTTKQQQEEDQVRRATVSLKHLLHLDNTVKKLRLLFETCVCFVRNVPLDCKKTAKRLQKDFKKTSKTVTSVFDFVVFVSFLSLT